LSASSAVYLGNTESFNIGIAAGVDLDTDGFSDLIVGAPGHSSGGALATYSGLALASLRTVGRGCGPPTTRPVLTVSPPRFGSQVCASVINTVPGGAGVLLMTGPPATAGPIVAGGCSFGIDLGQLSIAPLLPFVTDGAGGALISLGALPAPTASLANLSVRLQAFVISGTTVLGSNGIEARIGG